MGSRRNLRILSAIAVLFGMLAAVALPGVAQAHRQPPIAFHATAVTTAPTVDGVLGEGEWDDAPSSFVLFGELSGSVRFKNDAQYLYVALTVADSGIGAKSIGMYFDDDHDGLKDPGEDAILSFVGPGDTGQRLLLELDRGYRRSQPLQRRLECPRHDPSRQRHE